MKTIFLIDDDSDCNLLMQAFLEDHFRVFSYESAEKALADLEQHKPDLIIVDISMPVMSGVELLKEVRASHTIPVVALTGHAESGDREKYLEEGFDEYISKPILDVDRLVAFIEQLVHA